MLFTVKLTSLLYEISKVVLKFLDRSKYGVSNPDQSRRMISLYVPKHKMQKERGRERSLIAIICILVQ